MEWKDCTSYQRGDEKRNPNAWEVKSGSIRICITKGHIDYPGIWVMHCHSLGVSCQELKVDTKEEAQEKSCLIMRHKVISLLEDLDAI